MFMIACGLISNDEIMSRYQVICNVSWASAKSNWQCLYTFCIIYMLVVLLSIKKWYEACDSCSVTPGQSNRVVE